MKSHPFPFLDLEPPVSDFDTAAVAILPVPYEGGISYGQGTLHGPKDILKSSAYVELYDEYLNMEVCRMGIATLESLSVPGDAESMITTVSETVGNLLESGKFTVMIGGDHSITTGYLLALKKYFKSFSIIQLDAHADLRDSYENNSHSHACTMARAREITPHTLQLGIRSLSQEEATLIKNQNLKVVYMHELRRHQADLRSMIEQLPDPVYITLDVDVFDWSVVRSTGTPEPGGFRWSEMMGLLELIFNSKQIVGFDVVELSASSDDPTSSFAAARLIYRMLGFLLQAELNNSNISFPDSPRGSIFSTIRNISK